MDEITGTLQPLSIDKSCLVIEVLEDIEPTAEAIKGVSRLHAEGYTIALDDFGFERNVVAPMR